MNSRKFYTLLSLMILSLGTVFAQPTWVTNPNYTQLNAISCNLSFELNITSNIYTVVYVGNFTFLTSAQVRSASGSGTIPQRPYVSQLFNVSGPQTLNVTGLLPNKTYTILVVGEAGGILQANPFVIYPIITPACPPIDILTGFSQPIVCLTQVPVATFQVAILDPPTSGILKGTKWTLDWGDGSPVTNFTSAADYDIPPLALRQHNYTAITSCNYVFSNTIRNPCGASRSVQFVAVVHGRDVPSDGDGILNIVNNDGGSSVIQICEGIQKKITIRDNSTWNCQNPVLPGGMTAIPNTDQRNIEWLYGRDPDNVPQNTITGTVAIASLGNAPQTSFRMVPVPYGSNSLSQEITIPSSAQAGQYFRVYLKNWNKCNPNDADFVSTYVDIEVVSAPNPPQVDSKAYCLPDAKTLTVNNVPTGNIIWYNSSMVQVGTGLTYTPTINTTGTFTFYATDRDVAGLLCESVPATVTITVNPTPATPTLSAPAKNDICYGVEPPETYVITATAGNTPPRIRFQWFRDGVMLPGRVSDTIIISKPGESGSYTCSSVGVGPSFCFSTQSLPKYVTVHTLLNVTQPVDQVICEGGNAVFQATTTEAIASWQWERSSDGGLSFSTTGGSAPYTGFNTNTLTLTNPDISFSGWFYRVEMKTPAGQGGCRFKSQKARFTIDQVPTASAGTPISLCRPAGMDPILMTGSTKGGSSSTVTWTGGGGMGTWTQNTDPALAFYTPTIPSGSFTATLTIVGTTACGGATATGTRTITWAQTPSVEAGNNISRCDGTPLAVIAMTGAFAGGTYSGFNWTGGAGLGAWTQHATDPAQAVFTPSSTSGSFTATLTVTGTGACNGTNRTDTRIIAWGQTPVAVAGLALSRCDATPLAPFIMAGASASGTYTNLTWSGGAGLGTWIPNADPALARFTPTVSSGSFPALLSITGAAGCTGQNVTVSRTIEWSHAATVNAGPDQSICALLSVTLAGSFGGGATSASWVGGTGTFTPNRTTLNATYLPSAAETTAKTVTLTLTTNDPSGICPAVSDDISVAIGTLPTAAVLISSGNGCTGIASWISLGITGGAPPYSIKYKVNGGAVQNIAGYNSGANHNLGNLLVGIYTYTITEVKDACGNFLPALALPAPVSFQIYQNPVANAGSDKGVCFGLDAPLSAIPSVGTGTWSKISGPGVISFNPGVNNTSVTATASIVGTYVIRWTEVNNICSSSSDITVSYEKAADAGPNQNLCGTLSAILVGNTPASGTGTWTKVSGPGTVTFSPNANTPDATATVSQYGTYVLRWTLANGIFCSTNDDVTFTFEAAANAGADQHLCNTLTSVLTGNSPVIGTGAWIQKSGPSAVTFANAAAPGTTATVTTYGIYVFNWEIKNGTFCSSNDDISVTYNPAGQMNLPANQVLCNSTNTVDINFSTTNGSTIFTWTNSAPGIGLAATGSGNILSFPAINNGTAPVVATIVVTPIYSDGVVNCPGPTKTFKITVNPTAQINQPVYLVVCNGNPTGAINFSTANTPGTTTYSWTNDNNTIGLGDSGIGNLVSFNAVNGGITPVTSTITVTPLYDNGGINCAGTSKTFTITVNPKGQINVLDDIALCHNEAATVSFTTNNANGATTYTWTNSNAAIGLPVSGNGDNILFTATNAGTSPITGTITVTPSFSNGGTSCPGTAETFVVTVNPTARVNQPVKYTFCNGLAAAVAFTTNNTGGTPSYTWTNDNDGIGLGLSGSGDLSFTAANTGNAPILANITVTPSFNNAGKDCPGPSKSFTITINPTPQLSTSLTPPDVCSNIVFIYTPASSTAGTLFTWARADVAGITPAGPVNGVNGINETLRNTTNIPIAVTYRYTLSAGGCSSTQDVVVNVKPEPVIVPGQTSDLCSGNATNYFINLSNFTNPGDNVTFIWNAPVLNPVDARFSGGSARVSASSVNIQDAFTNTTGAAGTATYTVTAYKNGCAGIPVDIVMTVRSQPVLSSTLNKTVCSSTAINLTLAVAPGSVTADYYLILSRTLDAGLSADGGNAVINPVLAAPAGYLVSDKYLNLTGVPRNVIYRVRPVHAPDCFGAPVDVVITINPEPYIIPAQTQVICSGIAIGKEILLSPANIPAGTLFNWPVPTMDDGSVQGTAGVNVTAEPAGKLHINDVINNFSPAPITATYYITATSTPGCSSSAIPVVVTIKPEPMPKPITGRNKICINEANLIYEVTPTVGSTFHWTVDPAVGTKSFDFNSNAIIINAAAVPGLGNISVYETNSHSCNGDPFTLPVQVYPQAVPENVIGLASVCAGSTNPYNVTSRAGSVYSWTIPGGSAVIGDPSSASISVRFGNVGGQITCRETNEAGCVTIHLPITVSVKPLPNAIINGGGTICPGSTMNLFVDFTGTGPYTFTYAINGVSQAPVATASDPYTLVASQAGTYTIVSVTDATGCTNTGLGSAFVTYYPQSTGTISGGATMCGGTPTTLTITFTGTAPYTFTYSDGSTTYTVPNWGSNVYTASVIPAATCTYTLTALTDGNSCTGTRSGSATVTINTPPALTLTGTNLSCNGDNSGAVNLVVAGSNPFGFAWTGPLSYASNSQNISGLRAGNYSVTVTDTKGCTSASSVTLTEPGAINATLASTNVFCFGVAEGTITISAPSGGSGNFEYTINGGTSWSATGTFNGLNPGSYDVMIRDVATPACNKILNAALVITGPAILNATVTETDIVCYDAANGSIVLTNPSGGSGNWNYSILAGIWQGSGNFTNLAPGTYTVMIRDAAIPACTRTLATIDITQLSQLTATVSKTNVTCFGSTDGSISITAPAGGSGAWEYSINGGGSWQASGNFTNLTPGSYSVQIRDVVNPSCYRVLNNSLTIIQPAVLKATVTSSMITCNGANDGSINITAPSGGSGTYEYTTDGASWSGTSLHTGIVPGSYDVRIRDAANTSCEIILNGGLDITEPPALSGTVVKNNISCFGAGDGNITITNSLGGYGTYEYSVSGAGGPYQASNSFTGLDAGTYSVWMRDRIKTTCAKLLDNAVVIVEPAVLDADIASTNITCAGANNGTITISNPLGGFGTYQYSINGGGTWVGTGTFLNLSAGPYNVRIRDAASPACELILNNMLVITEPAALTATAAKTNVTCFGASNGTITINGAAGGYGSYGFTVDGGSNWQASNLFSGLLPGYYNVRMRDAANPSCMYTINSSLNIAGPAVLNASVAKTNVTCFNADNGTITISSQSGGYGTYQFSVDGGSNWFNTGIFNNLPPATYNVQIRDASYPACFIVLNPNVVITEPDALGATLSSINITCNGASDGRIIISGPTGGYGTYEYTINGGTLWSGSGNFLNLSQNTYDVRMRDAANPACVLIINNSLFISQPAPLNADLDKTNITCFGAGNGTITISNPTGGYLTYEYTINGGGSWQNTGSFINLGPGNYNVQIRDASNPTCIKVLNNALSIIQLPAVSAVLTSTMITCNGANDGIINITAPAGGSGNYEYTINGGGPWTGTSLYTGLAPGVYDVRVRDAVNPVCETILNGSLTITQPSVINASFTSTNITCNGANNGTITISGPSGGYGTYDYTIDGITWQVTGIFTNLTAGSYNVKIRDRAYPGCVKTLDGALIIIEPAILSATVNHSDVTCYAAGNGTITISGAAGGYGTYQYSNNGGVSWLSSGNFTGLTPGSYNVRIRDGANITCVSVLATVDITQPDALSASTSGINVTCNGANDGSISITGASGGYGTYGYSIDGGTTWQATGNFTALTPGFYNLQVRDAVQTGCVKVLGSLTITQPGILGAAVTKNDITCNGAADGRITISVPTGGYGTYQYSINGAAGPWQASGTFTGLAPAIYDVWIRDAAHTVCTAVLSAGLVISEPAALSATAAGTNITCNGASDGTIAITGAAGGYGSYQYTINGTNWFGSGLFTNLAPATYTVQMRDAANPGCVAVLGAITITQQPVLNATVTSINVTCAGGGDGSITITVPTGGYGNYEYSINGGGSWQITGAFTALVPGSYNVRMRDADHINCVKVLNNALNITQPAMLSGVITATMVTCNGANDGTISITNPLGGSGAYQYSVNGTNWFNSGMFTRLAPSTYNVQIRDAVNTACVITLNGSLIITEPAALDASVFPANVTCNGANNGTISITSPTGGYGTFEYSKDGTLWQATGQFNGLAPATYNIHIRDKAHPACVVALTPVVITEPAVLSASVTSTNVTCNSANDGTITLTNPLGGYGTYGYSVNGGASWQPTGIFTNLTPKTYDIRIRDAANTACVIILAPVTITQPVILSAVVSGTNVTCNGASDGTITVANPLGGYGTYDYSIDGGTAWQATGNFAALAPGFYNVQIRDRANPGCVRVINSSLRITEPGMLGATVTKNDITCNGAADGRITISVPTGGYGTYQYSIHGAAGPWQASGTFTGLVPVSYDVWIRDAAHTGCTAVLSAGLVITEPVALSAAISGTNITCNGASDGTISVTGAAGGYGSYQYTINGTNWFGSGLFTNLSPLVYTVQMRDAANPGCVAVLGAITITQQPVLNATVTSINVTCAGGGDGSITITVPTGGYGNYEYSINGGGSWQSSGSFTALVPGSYNVRMRDKDHINCVKILNNALNITQPAMLSGVVTATMVTCNGASDGIINITNPLGGTGSYEYSINGGAAGSWKASGTFPGLAPGTYDVQIRDAVNTACVITLNGSLIITEPAALDASVFQANVTCNGANNGTISITSPTGGYGTFEYSKDGATWQATGQFPGLAPATYNIRIRDKAHPACVVALTPVVITEPAVLSASVTSTNVTCFGANDGTITVTNPLGGYGTYGYSVNGGASWQPTGIFTNLAPNNYDVRIRDAANTSCIIALTTVTITQPVVLSGTATSTNVTCNGASDGTITISGAAGGYGTYDYSIDGGTTWQATGNFAGLAPGFYNVQVRDRANTGCVKIINSSLRITEPSILIANISKINVTCNGAGDGRITILGAAGGYGTYEYSISGGTSWQSAATFPGLAPGSYNVQIRDASHTGCVIVLDAALSITQPSVLSATIAPTMVTCFGASDGIISISNPSGGYGMYQYSVNGGVLWQGSGTFMNLAPGNYDVRIRDAVNSACVIILNPALTLTSPALLSASISGTNVTCFGGADGSITVSSPLGGYGTYEYSINGGGSWQASGSFTGLTPGSYNILIRDAAHTGCLKVLNNAYLITQPALLAATVSKTDVTCNGANDGTITISSPTGGTGTYEYSINGGMLWLSSGTFSSLVPATYDVRIRDVVNTACYVTLYPNLVISEPLPLTVSSTGNILLDCFGDSDGMGTFFGSGGTMPYTFTVLSNTTGATIAAPGFNSRSFYNAGTGSITIAVTDARGCNGQTIINITQPALLTPGTIGTDQVLCGGQNPAQLSETVPATGGPGAYSYQWQYSSNIAGPFITVAGATSIQYTPPAGATSTMYYRRMVTSGTCTQVYSNIIEVKVNPNPIAILSGGETICPTQSSILKVNMVAGTGPFELDIENLGTVTGYISGSDITVMPATTTTYKLLRVKDANGCEVTSLSNLLGSATVTVRLLPVITTSPVSKTTCEFGMVAFNVAATGSDLTYQWYVNEGTGFNPITDGGVYVGSLTSTLSIFGATRLMNSFVYHVVVSGCATSVTSSDATLTVNTAPEIVVQPKDSTICMNAGAEFNVIATGTGVSYQWQVYSGASFVNVVNDANFSGATLSTLTITNAPGAFNNYVFRVIISAACGAPVYSNFVTLRVYIAPSITLNPASKTICDGGGPVTFIANGSGLIDSLRWQVFTGGMWADVYSSAIYSGSTSQQLTLSNIPLAYNGNQYRLAFKSKCITIYSNSATLTVNSNPVVDFSAVDPINTCGGVPIVIQGNPTGGSGTYSQHFWTGDAGPLNNYFVESPTFNSTIPGVYALNYRVRDSNGCYGSDDLTVMVDKPSADFIKSVQNGCTPLSVSFVKDMTGLVKFWWNFDDGSPLDSVNANPTHVFTNTNPASIEFHDVKLTVRSPGGCLDTYTSLVTVYPKINASFTANKNIVCSGGSITFTSAPGASKYFWDYGNGNSGYSSTESTTQIYTNFTTVPVVHTVTLTTTSFYNCTDVKTINITVMPVPLPQFTAVPTTQIYNPGGNPVTFTDQTNAGTWAWLWKFGDGATSADQNPAHNYTNVGNFNVTLIVSNTNCSDSIMHQVFVTPIPPVADFDSIPSGCEPLYVNVNNTSLNTETPGTSFRWDFGDGNFSTAKNPAHNWADPGSYRVELTVTGPGGTSVKSQVVHSYRSPIASLELAPSYVFVNDESVRFFNLSQGADNYLWEFGDGDTSKMKEPLHKYMEAGVFDVTLWAYSNNGCSDKNMLSPGVTVESAGELRFSTVFTPNLDGPVEMDHLPTGGTEIDKFFFPPIREKVINYKLQIFNRLGVLIFESRNINIPWNGYYKGKLCPQGVYVWYVEGKYANGKPFRKVGDVTILH